MADGESEFGVLTGILSSRKNVPRKTWRYTENGDELSGDNSRVNCIFTNKTTKNFFFFLEKLPGERNYYNLLTYVSCLQVKCNKC